MEDHHHHRQICNVSVTVLKTRLDCGLTEMDMFVPHGWRSGTVHVAVFTYSVP